MSTVTQTPRGWSFIHKGQRYEYPTKDAACEALYDLQHGKQPASDLISILDWIDAEDERLTIVDSAARLLASCPREEHTIPRSVGAIVYPLIAACLKEMRVVIRDNPHDWLDPSPEFMHPIGALADSFSDPDTVAALMRAWITAV
jgi:hypothetical protein